MAKLSDYDYGDAVADEVRRLSTSKPEASASTSFTFALADANKYKRFTASSAVTATVPPNASVAFPIGTQLEGEQSGTGQVTFAAGSGVTIDYPATKNPKIAEQYGQFILKKTDTDRWTLGGYLESP